MRAVSQVWAVSLTYDVDADEETLVEWGEALDASVSAVPGGGALVVLHVDSDDGPLAAAGVARDEAWKALGVADPVAVEVVSEDAYLAAAAAPSLPRMMSAPEVGELLGVSRQRVHQLQATAGFPAPLVRLRTGPVWDARAVESFASRWDRRPGRRRVG